MYNKVTKFKEDIEKLFNGEIDTIKEEEESKILIRLCSFFSNYNDVEYYVENINNNTIHEIQIQNDDEKRIARVFQSWNEMVQYIVNTYQVSLFSTKTGVEFLEIISFNREFFSDDILEDLDYYGFIS